MWALLRQGWAWKDNHVHRIMHILDVISSVSRSSRCTKIGGGRDFTPDPTVGAYSGTQDLAGFNQAHFKTPTYKRWREERGEGASKWCMPPGAPETLVPPLVKWLSQTNLWKSIQMYSVIHKRSYCSMYNSELIVSFCEHVPDTSQLADCYNAFISCLPNWATGWINFHLAPVERAVMSNILKRMTDMI